MILYSIAIEYSNGNKYWYYENNYYGCSNSGYNQEEFLEDLKKKTFVRMCLIIKSRVRV